MKWLCRVFGHKDKYTKFFHTSHRPVGSDKILDLTAFARCKRCQSYWYEIEGVRLRRYETKR